MYSTGYMRDTCKIHHDTTGYVSDRKSPPQNDRKPPNPGRRPPGFFWLFAIRELVSNKPCVILAASWWVSGDGQCRDETGDAMKIHSYILGSWCNIRTHLLDERARLDHESTLSRSGLWAKILGEEPLFSCMDLSFEERFGNVARLCPRWRA